MDKRIVKTRANIKSAYIKLINSSKTGKLGVSELAAKSLVNRSTFYLHYSGVDDVAEDVAFDLALTVSDLIKGFSLRDTYGSLLRLFEKATARLEANPDMKKYIFNSPKSYEVTGRLKNMFAEKAICSLLDIFPSMAREEIEYPITYAVGGAVETYVRWMKNGETDLGELIRQTGKITESIINSVNPL